VRGIGFRYRVALLSGFWASFAAIAASCNNTWIVILKLMFILYKMGV